jgi:hypothetical protein
LIRIWARSSSHRRANAPARRYFVVQPASALLERQPTYSSVTLKKLPDAAALPPPAVAALGER